MNRTGLIKWMHGLKQPSFTPNVLGVSRNVMLAIAAVAVGIIISL